MFLKVRLLDTQNQWQKVQMLHNKLRKQFPGSPSYFGLDKLFGEIGLLFTCLFGTYKLLVSGRLLLIFLPFAY